MVAALFYVFPRDHLGDFDDFFYVVIKEDGLVNTDILCDASCISTFLFNIRKLGVDLVDIIIIDTLKLNTTCY